MPIAYQPESGPVIIERLVSKPLKGANQSLVLGARILYTKTKKFSAMKPVKKKKILCGLVLTVILIAATGASALADIYMYIDSNGVLHFSNVPTSSQYRIYIMERPASLTDNNNFRRYDQIIREAAKTHGLSEPLLKAIIKAESNFNPRAVSKRGAKGLMQIMPKNFHALNIRNPFNPRENIMGGAKYFKRLHVRYNGKLPLALAAYNAGPQMVDKYKKIPPFPETHNFVEKVMKYFYAYRN
jgi:soluble lytic murein transglycosylase-like protein